MSAESIEPHNTRHARDAHGALIPCGSAFCGACCDNSTSGENFTDDQVKLRRAQAKKERAEAKKQRETRDYIGCSTESVMSGGSRAPNGSGGKRKSGKKPMKPWTCPCGYKNPANARPCHGCNAFIEPKRGRPNKDPQEVKVHAPSPRVERWKIRVIKDYGLNIKALYADAIDHAAHALKRAKDGGAKPATND